MRWGRVRGGRVIHFKLASWVGREEPCCNTTASGSQTCGEALTGDLMSG